jgi:hypothetical protein
VTGGAIGVGVSTVETDVNVLSTATTLDTDFTVHDITVSADEARASADADTAYSSAQGIVGALIGTDATVTRADHIGNVTALLGAGTSIIASGTVAATARGDNRQRAYSDSCGGRPRRCRRYQGLCDFDLQHQGDGCGQYLDHRR